MRQSVIILDEEHGSALGAEIRGFLQEEGGYEVDLTDKRAASLSTNTRKLQQTVVPILPSNLRSAEALLEQFRAAKPPVCLLPVVRTESLSDLFEPLVHSATDFLVAPLKRCEVTARVRRLVGCGASRDGEKELEQLTAAAGLTPLVGEDPSFREMKRKIFLLAQSECAVLITGETGTGKELCARALHYSGHRAQAPFLPINCGAIPVELFENELFGHQKGAFTGAWNTQTGLIAEAEGGTLLLDEIEALSLTSQVKLLRFLQDQTYYVVGSPRARKANVRIIASTNLELRSKIESGTFREDLYHRLAVIRLDVPPLRERISDIPVLADHFWKIYMPDRDRRQRHLTPAAIELMCKYSWPGNVRELQSLIQHIILLGEGDSVRPEDLPIFVPSTIDRSEPKSFARRKVVAIEEFERSYVQEALRLHEGNVTRAAEGANKDRRAFGRLIKKYGIAKR